MILNTETEVGRRAVDFLERTGLPIEVRRDETTDTSTLLVIEYEDAHLSDGQRVIVDLVNAYDRARRYVMPDDLDRVVKGP